MNIVRPLSKQPIPKTAKKVFSGILFDVYQWEQKQFDGTTKIFEKIGRRDTAGVIATTTNGKILMLEQKQPQTQPFIGLPGGIIDEGEDVLASAKRELLEETGYSSNSWDLFDATQPTSKIDWAIYIFIARNCKKIQNAALDSGEQIVLKEISWKDFLELLTNDLFRDHELILKSLKILKQPDGEKILYKQIFDKILPVDLALL